jgi:hypothetical protein
METQRNATKPTNESIAGFPGKSKRGGLISVPATPGRRAKLIALKTTKPNQKKITMTYLMAKSKLTHTIEDLNEHRDYQIETAPLCLGFDVILTLNNTCDYYENGISRTEIVEIWLETESGWIDIIKSVPSDLVRQIAWELPDAPKHR